MTWPTKEGVPTLPEGVADDSVAMETGTSGCSEDAMTVAPSSESLPNVLHVTLLKKPGYCEHIVSNQSELSCDQSFLVGNCSTGQWCFPI